MYPRDDVSIVALKFVISVDEKIIFPVVLKYYIPCSIPDSLRTPPPNGFLYGDFTQNHTVKSTIPTGSIYDKKA